MASHSSLWKRKHTIWRFKKNKNKKTKQSTYHIMCPQPVSAINNFKAQLSQHFKVFTELCDGS